VTAPRDIQNLALIGFMGTGKTTVGHLVAHQLGFAFVDTDRLIEQQAGKPIPRIFAEDGEVAFRELERRVVAGLASHRRTVIATGGGLGANPELLASLKTHALVVCLWASVEVIWERVRHATHRPLLQVADPRARIEALLHERAPIYRQADVLLLAGPRESRVVADLVARNFQLHRGAPSAA
jgi:shikimate kinase